MIFRVNLVGAELFGLERHRLLGRRFSRFISPDWVDRFYDHRRQCLDTRERQTCELKLKSDAENQRYIHVESIELDDLKMINIYRIVQEGLNNVQKHAEADHVNVTFSYSHPDILLRIIDNWKAFDVEKRLTAITTEKRMGLRSMEESAKLLGGTIEVQSMPMNGTKIFIRIPNGGKTHGRKENHPHC